MVQLCKRSSFAERVPSALFTVTGRKILIKPSLTYDTVRGRWLESSTYKEAENLDHIKVFGFFIYSPLVTGTFILMGLIQNESLHLLQGCPSPWSLLL